jgi:hypothetical protein
MSRRTHPLVMNLQKESTVIVSAEGRKFAV